MNIQKRLILLGVIFLCCMSLLIARLMQIQLISTESFSKHQINLIAESVKQRTHSLTINDGRGQFVDRNGLLISAEMKPAIVLFPFLQNKHWPIDKIAEILRIRPSFLTQSLKTKDRPFILDCQLTEQQMEQVNDLKIPGVYAQYIARKKSAPFANHLLGVTGEDPDYIRKMYPERLEKGDIAINTKIGKTGLQKAFDPFLLSEGETKLIYHVDRAGGPLFGLDVKYAAQANPYYPVTVQTTIDKRKQQILEKAIDQQRITNGGAVLLDVATSELLGMVSRPVTDGLSANEMLRRHSPGSIFKIVTAAAAIENDTVSSWRTFNCDLGIDQKKARIPAGRLSFNESFAQSCNATFGILANELILKKQNVIENYAKRLGLLGISGWTGDIYHFEHFRQFPEEEKGVVWKRKRDKTIPLAVSQTAIGQLNVQVSPLAIANMMATIARGGKGKEVRAVTSIRYKNGSTLASFPSHQLHKETISNYTAMKLQELLRLVVTHSKGTGRALNGLPYAVAGKSGTAEKGKGNSKNNKWFAGYFPFDRPKYALVVVDLDQKTENRTIKAFSQIVTELYKSDSK
ncbi:peptidoglycan D,D-transpeptidase FtsI family protein [Fictibacillus gelatini]|uniref:peptidoglycan D,D-transpeptidase FtsI family protein n=1 Tax=Fictibacillus gelatini TaxID=225985 RepID=UPI0004174229|nr:penicillin-binding protein 2 [Fictibacillus gelatini]